MKTIATRNLDASPQGGDKIPVGISACLLGKPVRYNGGHSQSRLCLGELSRHFDYRAFCPELEAGFGVPRPTLRLTGDPSDPRMVFSNDASKDVTDRFKTAVADKIEGLAGLDGYILMKNSPSCGLERIKVYRDNGYPHTERTQGLFTAALRQRFPDLPVEEEGRLNDARLRENFILRVFAHHHFRRVVEDAPSLGRLMGFHRDYKYILMAHNQQEYRALGRLLAQAGKEADIGTLQAAYKKRFMAALAKPATRRSHCNVLLHILGYLKRALDGATRRDIMGVIEQYRRGEVNLATPLTLISHYVRRCGSDYIQAQRYLEPYPAPLGLRNQL
ncbi:DUF523 and DUF1722 domain-containing protein [Motiliproteus sp. SC1-56]|uniref:YbgA family protein n=1 Tax=Motiliproteus sp. SC1-56 TaxID=2799565 RepID=UPI001A8EAF6A|nr:DUF523 and DUF1722 domain-containing protein [Motiliproteus sp. SC1-56]